jgi:hypothetical protein
VGKTAPAPMVYQRGQFWIRRYQQQAASLCAALVALTTAVPAADFVHRGLLMLEAIGWIPAHRFLFADLRFHLLGWPRSLAPDGRRATLFPRLAYFPAGAGSDSAAPRRSIRERHRVPAAVCH